MKKIIITILAITSLVACKKKNSDAPVPSNAPITSVIEKDSTGKILGGSKYTYNGLNLLVKSVDLDSLGHETNNGSTYTYNANNQITSLTETYTSSSNAVSTTSSNFIYMDGLVTKKVIFNKYSDGSTYKDSSTYTYNVDRTLKYKLTAYDSTVFSAYANGKPGLVTSYAKYDKSIQYTYFNTFDGNGNLIKQEYQSQSSPKYTSRVSTYSIVSVLTENTDPTPEYAYQNTQYITLYNAYYYIPYNSTTSYKESESFTSNFKASNNQLTSFDTKYINYNSSNAVVSKSKFTLYIQY